MFDYSFCFLRSLIFGEKSLNRFPKGAMHAFCGLVVELHMHTKVYAVYACGCYG